MRSSHHDRLTLAGLTVATMVWLTTLAVANPITAPPHHGPDLQRAVREAAQAVDRAWETFHEAALSGTLASPAVQTRVEQALHESRALLLEAREALDRNDRAEVERIVTRIHALTDKAMTLSRERKR